MSGKINFPISSRKKIFYIKRAKFGRPGTRYLFVLYLNLLMKCSLFEK